MLVDNAVAVVVEAVADLGIEGCARQASAVGLVELVAADEQTVDENPGCRDVALRVDAEAPGDVIVSSVAEAVQPHLCSVVAAQLDDEPVYSATNAIAARGVRERRPAEA